jgi:hypothetical protein
MLDIKGNSKINSTSKTRKIIAIRKNRKVKGNRALNLGENPHSKGLSFSRSKTSFLLKITPKKLTTAVRINTLTKKTEKIIILQIYLSLLLRVYTLFN